MATSYTCSSTMVFIKLHYKVMEIKHKMESRLYDAEDRICDYALTNAAGRSVSVAFAYDGSHLTNTVFTMPNGSRFSAMLSRETGRKHLVTRRDYSFNDIPIYWYSTEYDLRSRPTNAMDSAALNRAWNYNRRSELVSANTGTNRYEYAYDTIGNRLWSASNAATNSYSANCLNQHTAISNLCGSAYLREPSYDADGNLLLDGVFRYSYDAKNRLVVVRSASLTNGAIRVLNAYDHNHRRVRKTVQRLMLPASVPPAPPQSGEWTTTETHTFFYDDWNLIEERISRDDGTDFTNRYVWGKDLSGSLQGAGGIGGLLAVLVSENTSTTPDLSTFQPSTFQPYFPCYDHNGNIVRYVSETGAVSASYSYDPFGNIIAATAPPR